MVPSFDFPVTIHWKVQPWRWGCRTFDNRQISSCSRGPECQARAPVRRSQGSDELISVGRMPCLPLNPIRPRAASSSTNLNFFSYQGSVRPHPFTCHCASTIPSPSFPRHDSSRRRRRPARPSFDAVAPHRLRPHRRRGLGAGARRQRAVAAAAAQPARAAGRLPLGAGDRQHDRVRPRPVQVLLQVSGKGTRPAYALLKGDQS